MKITPLVYCLTIRYTFHSPQNGKIHHPLRLRHQVTEKPLPPRSSSAKATKDKKCCGNSGCRSTGNHNSRNPSWSKTKSPSTGSASSLQASSGQERGGDSSIWISPPPGSFPLQETVSRILRRLYSADVKCATHLHFSFHLLCVSVSQAKRVVNLYLRVS